MSDSPASTNAQWDTENQVTWFICVQKEPSWEEERFRHEFQVVHAEMTRIGNQKSGLPLNYVQFGANELKDANNPSDKNIDGPWDFLTCLRWPSTDAIHKTFQNPGYRATAGKHVFCRLDQKGLLAKKAGAVGAAATEERFIEQGNFAIHAFHRKGGEEDKTSASWTQSRMDLVEGWTSSSESPLKQYSVWTDITPDNTDAFFADTQFIGGYWHHFDAVERFVFENSDEATRFWIENRYSILGATTSTLVVGGSAAVVV